MSAESSQKMLVYIGLGSNLSQPKQQIYNAVSALKNIPSTDYLADSGIYLSRALSLGEDEPQDDYCNAVAQLETELDPIQLLDRLQSIEVAQGRTREKRWGPRTIDLDILLYGDLQIDDERLKIPHPGLSEREFVLYPLSKLDASLEIPGHGKLDELVKACPLNGLRFVGDIA